MTTRVLLGSGGFRTPERIEFLRAEMRRHFGSIGRLLFIPFALSDYDGTLQSVLDRGLNADYDLDGVHQHADPARAVVEAQGIFITGGNTFRLLHQLYVYGFLDLIRDRVEAGVPYLGISAGANVACPTIKTTNDMPILQPTSFEALGLVPFQLNPHYYAGANYIRTPMGYEPHFGETRDERLHQFHEENATPVVGLAEGGVLRCEGVTVTLHGAAARVFRRDESPRDFEPGADLSALLNT